jgi:hypothetical protein
VEHSGSGRAGDDVKHFYKNPRVITKKQMTALGVTMGDLGDLSGITHCLDTDQILTGNQRMEVIPGAMSGVTQPTITERFEPPLPDGTALLGYYEYKGLRFNYRAVKDWDDDKREQANIVANKGGGDFDFDVLANEFEFEKLIDYGFEEWELVDPTGFSGKEELDESAEAIKYKKMLHVLVSIPVDLALDAKEIIEQLEQIDGIEVVYGAN